MSCNLLSSSKDESGGDSNLMEARSANNHTVDEDQKLHGSTISAFSFHKDIELLTQLCQEHEQKLTEMTTLYQDQINLSQLLLQQEEDLLLAFNDLELKGQQFNDLNTYLMMKCLQVQREVSSLHCVQLHSSLFHISIDDRGWRYPLINSLRLSHKPKGDLAWSEINAAWSQASQLALFLGNSFHFSSPNLRIIPLSTCAKIIEFQLKGTKVIHNIGVELLESLKTTNQHVKGIDTIVHAIYIFYQYVNQLLKHVKQMKQHLVAPVLQKQPNKDIETLQEDNDLAWSTIIHTIAATLKWLSEHATEHSCIEG